MDYGKKIVEMLLDQTINPLIEQKNELIRVLEQAAPVILKYSNNAALNDSVRAALKRGGLGMETTREALEEKRIELALKLTEAQAEIRRLKRVVEAASDVRDIAGTLPAFLDDPIFHQACSVLNDRLNDLKGE